MMWLLDEDGFRLVEDEDDLFSQAASAPLHGWLMFTLRFSTI